ncbi:uncharacterized protein Tco025E_08818 [Trypanosoma conorhini]|uniref:RanBP2-type domain-containing protein n=1 Tax=Trypanosoma conorhini TaxID=83891 RepID=A0A422N4I0_9TRYP|nr:uncharacterized protein Tco025E_08818 [Trypanosoma conorhini]RNF00350.1 hypothetical protein Tco025E_08818 [Trypanosoma conorhini]
MRLPASRTFNSLHMARSHGAIFGHTDRAVPPYSALALGMEFPPKELFQSSMRVVQQERLPPFLALTLLTRCWTAWTVTSAAAGMSRVRGDDDDDDDDGGGAALAALLAASEESLRLYRQKEEDTEQEFGKCGPRRRAREEAEVSKRSLTVRKPVDRHGYHHVVQLMLRCCGSQLTQRALVSLLQYAVQVEDSEGAVLTELMGLLDSVTESDHMKYEGCLRAVLATTLSIHVAPVVLSILRGRKVNVEVVKLCLHHLAIVVRGRHTGAILVESAMGGFHECAVAALRWLLGNASDRDGDLYIQVMSCLKHAPVFLLCEVYRTMEEHNLLTASVQCKFLANCGIAVAVSNVVPCHCIEVIVRAFRALSRSHRETRHIEEGLVHGSAVLVVLHREELVREAYAARPMLRETPHSVMAHVRSGDVPQSHQALLRLAQSREEGWINIPLSAVLAIHAVCTLVGRSGDPADMNFLYHALVSFHNPGMIVSQCIEYVVAGLCDRVARIDKEFSKDTAPRVVLGHVLPLLRTVARYVGDDINTDMVLQLLETAVTLRHFAVPLTSSILWNLQRSSSLALKELFSRVDPSTNGIPFLNYYTLCFARDQGRRETVEHLSMVWRCDPDPVLTRHASLAPAYKLWKCASCGRLNSDRFNYCLCSALRNSFVVCSGCGNAQDERWRCCQSCGEGIRKEAIAAVVVRRSWSCDNCGASNPARQTYFCFRCKALTGPVAKVTKSLKGIEQRHCSCPSNKELNAKNAWRGVVQYCRRCGWFREAWAAINSVVWHCEGCGELRSSLDRACPDCPQVECLPFAVVRKNRASVSCPACRLPSDNPFAIRCLQCDAPLQQGPLVEEIVVGTTMKGETQVAFRCSHCGAMTMGGTASNNCRDCGGDMRDADRVHVASRHCDGCGNDVEPLLIEAICSHCTRFLPPVSSEGWSVSVILETLKRLVQLVERDGVNERLTTLLQELLCSFQTQVELRVIEESRVLVAVELGRLQTRLYKFIAYDALVRRVIALTKQLLEYIDTKCGLLETPHFLEGQCRHCLGTHPKELCVYHKEPWICEECGAENSNADVCSYVCQHCLALRPCVQEKCPTEAWECLQCQRVNVEFEAFCIFCGVQRAAVESAVEEAAEACPFLPAKCATCGLVHLEARCPLCHNDVPESMRDAEGVVCMVTNRYVFIQPSGTEHPNQRVHLGEPWLRRRQWAKGDKVTFTAKVNERGGFRVTSIRP